MIAPIFKQFSLEYAGKAVFVKINGDGGTAMNQKFTVGC